MAYDAGMAQILRDDLVGESLIEKKMFGGLCFMLAGNMLCGVHKGGAMFRVGPDQYETALALPGGAPMMFTKKPMKGFVECAPDAFEDDTKRAAFLSLSLSFVKSLPPK
jgi:hypothetical protein